MLLSPPPLSDGVAESIEALRARIRAIERSVAAPGAFRSGLDEYRHENRQDETCWTSGAAEIDAMLGPRGLETGAVHELKPVATGADWPAACAAVRNFALMLGVRRLRSCSGPDSRRHVLWCASTSMTAEYGTPYGPGLRALGLDPARLVIVEPVRQQDALWALEEGLKSDALALVFAQLDGLDLTPARRLALAAARARTPCLLLTHPREGPAAATATRWRIGPAPSSPHPLIPQVPGAPRFGVSIERCRGRPAPPQDLTLMLEWCDAAYRFRMAPAVADRADAAGTAGARSLAGRR